MSQSIQKSSPGRSNILGQGYMQDQGQIQGQMFNGQPSPQQSLQASQVYTAIIQQFSFEYYVSVIVIIVYLQISYAHSSYCCYY